MSSLFSLALTTALLCGIWSSASGWAGLLGWAGFAGCTTFFACGGKACGIKTALFTNLSGVFWGMLAIGLDAVLPFPGSGGVYCALVTFMMCIQSKLRWFSFIPGTFVGCFSTFAAGGDWPRLVLSLVLGSLLGFACEWSGNWLFTRFGKK